VKVIVVEQREDDGTWSVCQVVGAFCTYLTCFKNVEESEKFMQSGMVDGVTYRVRQMELQPTLSPVFETRT
jgi:hypothetical protein